MTEEEQEIRNIALVLSVADAIYGPSIVDESLAEEREAVVLALDAFFSKLTGEPAGTLTREMEAESADQRWRRFRLSDVETGPKGKRGRARFDRAGTR